MGVLVEGTLSTLRGTHSDLARQPHSRSILSANPPDSNSAYLVFLRRYIHKNLRPCYLFSTQLALQILSEKSKQFFTLSTVLQHQPPHKLHGSHSVVRASGDLHIVTI